VVQDKTAPPKQPKEEPVESKPKKEDKKKEERDEQKEREDAEWRERMEREKAREQNVQKGSTMRRQSKVLDGPEGDLNASIKPEIDP
jgi:hypothetical protein